MPKNSRELKNKILKSLNDWCLDPLGDLVDAKALMNRTYRDINSYWFRYLKDDEANPNWRTEPITTLVELTPEDHKEVKEAMIKEITQTPHDWKIEQEGDLTTIKHKSGRKHWKSEFLKGSKKGFSGEEWTEIENALNKSKQTDFTSNPNNNSNNGFPVGWVIGGIVLLVAGGLIMLFIAKSKKK